MLSPESVSLAALIDSSGRSDVSGQYHADSYGLEAIKQAEREKVLEHLMLWLCPHYPAKLLSMPGLSWAFENMLIAAHPKAQVIGIERSHTIYLRSRRLIPGVKHSELSEYTSLQHRFMRFGIGDFHYSRVTMHRKREGKGCGPKSYRSNRLLNMDVETYMSMLTTDYRATMAERQDFNSRFYMRNCVWLDFTSQLCGSVERALQNLLFCFDAQDKKPKPVAITIMNARDGIVGANNRVARILQLQPALIYDKHWTYVGKNGTPMLTFCGHVE